MTPKKANVVVLGAGIVGLTTAVRLCEEGHTVQVWTKAITGLASDNCGGLWEPFHIEPEQITTPLCMNTRNRLIDETNKLGSSVGLRWYPIWQMFREGSEAEMADIPKYSAEVGLKTACLGEHEMVVQGKHIGGWYYDTIVASMPEYMAYLRTQLLEKFSVEIRIMDVPSTSVVSTFEDAKREYGDDVVMVNCTGLASRELCNDTHAYPIRGVVIKAKIPESAENVPVYTDDTPGGLTYTIPNGELITLGGIAESDSFDEEASLEEVQAIIARCTDAFPVLRTAKIVKVWAGLRPARPLLRLEVDEHEANIIHNYGHGGAGFTASWGSGDRVCELIAQL